jgi:hypothetical protein
MPIELPLGAIEDCRRGEDPSAVFFGDWDRGGGRCVRLFLRIWCAVVRSGMEPAFAYMSVESTGSMRRVRKFLTPFDYVLSCMSMDSDAVAVSPRFGGDFSGDEKMPEMGSRPCSSYTPRSASVIPVFLELSAICPGYRSSGSHTFLAHQHCRTGFRGFRVFSEAPFLVLSVVNNKARATLF